MDEVGVTDHVYFVQSARYGLPTRGNSKLYTYTRRRRQATDIVQVHDATMPDPQNPNQQQNLPSSSSTSSSSKKTPEISPNTNNNGFSGHRVHYPNPPDPANPDPATLRKQWRSAIKQYDKLYSHAWGTAILAGISLFALGWIIKGGNPLPTFHDNSSAPSPSSSSSSDNDKKG